MLSINVVCMREITTYIKNEKIKIEHDGIIVDTDNPYSICIGQRARLLYYYITGCFT